MRALKDFNIPKIIADDLPVFTNLVKDLFPMLDPPRKQNFNFEIEVKVAAIDLKLQPEDNFILKVPVSTIYFFLMFLLINSYQFK